MTTNMDQQLEGRSFGLTSAGQIVVQDPVTGLTYAVTPLPTDDLRATMGNLNLLDQTQNATLVGTLPASPAAGLAVQVTRKGVEVVLDLTFTAMPIICTDAGAGGSSGSTELFDLIAQGFVVIGGSLDLTVTNASAQTTGAGNMAQILAVGTTAAVAGDGALPTTASNVVSATGTITSVANVGTGKKFSGAQTAIDGSSVASKFYLNWSGTAATSTANGTTTVTGTGRIALIKLGV